MKGRQEYIDRINATTRWIAYSVYGSFADNVKFIKSYDKLGARVFLDHDFRLTKGLGVKDSMFKSLDDEEIALVFESAMNLRHMYTEAKGRGVYKEETDEFIEGNTGSISS